MQFPLDEDVMYFIIMGIFDAIVHAIMHVKPTNKIKQNKIFC